MPSSKQALKRMRQTQTRKTRNRARKTAIKTYTKKVLKAIEAKDVDAANENLRNLQTKLDKAAKGGTLHRNKAARRVSRMQQQVNALQG